MLKRQIILLLVLALLLPQALAAPDNLIPYAQSHLTEVYGYTQAQADAFVFEDDGAGSLRGWEREHPQWVYTFQYDMQTGEIRGAQSPFFHPEFVIYPGEGGIRDILNLAGEEGWFQNWNPASLQAFAEALQRYNSAQPSIELLAGLSIGDISASQAVEGLFSAFVGPKGARPPAADAWLKEVLGQQGLQPDGPYLLPLGEAVTLENPYIRSVVYTRFTTPAPAGLQGVFSHPKLAGWACIEGITMERSLISEFGVDIGLAAFEKEGARLLIMLVREKGKEWALYPVGENALRRGLNMTISPKAGMMNGFQIIYDIAPGQREVFEVNIGGDSREGRYACRLERYERSDASKGYVFTAQSTPQGWDLLEIRGEDRQSLHVDGCMFAYMEAITDIENFPHNLQAWSQMPGSLIPPGYAMLNGVRLREKATTKSPSLGMFHPGTLLQIIDQEGGTSWLHGRVGRLSGYASRDYAAAPENPNGNSITWTEPLPAARAKQDINLRSAIYFHGDGAALAAGTKMHVLSDQGEWLYVAVPRGALGWLMDVEGRFGYVKKEDVDMAATEIQLDWMP